MKTCEIIDKTHRLRAAGALLFCYGLAGAVVGSSVSDHNSWNTGLSVTAADFVSVDPAGADGPRQADGSLPDLDFLKPKQGGRLIDAGTDVGLDFSGDAPDLGAYEWEPASAARGATARRVAAGMTKRPPVRTLVNGRIADMNSGVHDHAKTFSGK